MQLSALCIRHVHISHNAPFLPPPPHPPPPLPPKILQKLCFSLLLGITAVLREIENNANAKFWLANKVYIWEMCKWRIDLRKCICLFWVDI